MSTTTKPSPRIWLVTGSSRGLGRVLVEAILASGDTVVATARNPNSLTALVEQYGAERILTSALDVTDTDQILKVVDLAQQTFGRLDFVINNAGYAETASIEDMDTKSFHAQFDTNFFGVVNVSRAVLPLMRKQGFGHIMQVSSLGGRMGSPGLGAYQSAKWAVGGFSTVLAQEVAPFGIKITVLEPGGMATDWSGSSMGDGPISEPYQQTVGAFKDFREGLSATFTPPAKVADAIIHLSRVDNPPLRILLGADTIGYAKQVAEQQSASDEKWQSVTKLEF
ncbi:hypothetical protein G7046_g6933 [Stylonectria norvegica]|nr:hypothetical protein G7046_g6933 [Stylonectria norvegica]